MKKILLFLLLLFSLSSKAQWIEKFSSKDGFYQVEVLNQDNLFASDVFSGALLKSVNGGLSWDTINFPNAWYFKLQFLNDSIGFIGGRADFVTGPTYFKTKDGGNTWDTMQVSSGGGIPSHSFHFVNKDTGFVTHYKSVIKTSDGGFTFPDTFVFPINQYYWIGAITFINQDTGFVALTHNEPNERYVFRNRIFKTVDQGIQWTEVFSETTVQQDTATFNVGYPMIQKIYVSKEKNIYCIGLPGKIIQTNNAGLNWTTQLTPISDKPVLDIQFIHADTGYILTDHKLFKTTNSAQSWQRLIAPQDSLLRHLHFLNGETGFIAGLRLYKTERGTIPTSIQSPAKLLSLGVYPNPNFGTIYLHNAANYKLLSVQVLNCIGQHILELDSKKKIWRVGDLPSGLYFITIHTDVGSITEKIFLN